MSARPGPCGGRSAMTVPTAIANNHASLPRSYCTTWFTTEDVLFAEKASLRYSAVIGCVPTASVDLVSLATPPLNVAEPIASVPSRNFTLPVGAGPVLVPCTCAVNVTACPKCEGFGLEVRLVVVGYL